MEKICSAFGHREMYTKIKEPLIAVLNRLVAEQSVSYFYTGGMGEFDRMFSSAVRVLKHTYPHIRLFLVVPYYSARLNTDRALLESEYDEVILPAVLDDLHYKAAIKARNRWMIDQSNYVVTCVYKKHGGAYEAMRYAIKQRKLLINLPVEQ